MAERSRPPRQPDGPAPTDAPDGFDGLPDTLDGLLADAAARWPGHPAIVAGARRTTFAELDGAASALAAVLAARVPGTGGVIAVSALLDPDFTVAYYGVLRSGNVVATVNPLLREDVLAHVLAMSGARAALVDSQLYERLSAVRDRLPQLREVILIGAPAGGSATAGPGRPPHLADLIAPLPGRDAPPPAPAPSPSPSSSASPELDGVACLHFTSGTTGRPKAVRLTHRNLLVNARQITVAHGLDHSSVTVNHLPTFHPMHQNSALLAGATHVLCGSPDPVASVQEANLRRATHLYSMPFRLARLAADERLPQLRLETVTRIASGGSALSPEAAGRLSEHFAVPVFQGYGLAETSPLTHSDDPVLPVHGSVGRPVPGTRCRVVDVETRQELPAGSPGEVQVSGPQVMRGYVGRPDLPVGGLGGWLSTGDIGRIAEDGRLFLVDRSDDVFKYHNWLISPTEVERALARHPLVVDCVVFGRPRPPDGSVPHALLVLRPGVDAEVEEALREVCAQANARLAYFQQVRFAQAVESIPRSPNGKVRRRALLDRHRLEDPGVLALGTVPGPQ